MTPEEHYREAERLIAMCVDSDGNPPSSPEAALAHYIDLAQVHATLATFCPPRSPAPLFSQPFVLADEVRRARRDLGLSIEEAGKRAGISHVTWGNVESGRLVRQSTYTKVDAVLGWPRGTAQSKAASS